MVEIASWTGGQKSDVCIGREAPVHLFTMVHLFTFLQSQLYDDCAQGKAAIEYRRDTGKRRALDGVRVLFSGNVYYWGSSFSEESVCVMVAFLWVGEGR